MLISAVTWSSSSGPAYHGLLPLFAVASAGTILGAISLGSFRNILSARPFVEIGRRSYGIYLFHWPVFVLVTDRTFDISRYGLFAIRCVITFAIAGLSFAFFEQPMHATVSGEVVGYEKRIDQSGKVVDCLIVKNDKKVTKVILGNIKSFYLPIVMTTNCLTLRLVT